MSDANQLSLPALEPALPLPDEPVKAKAAAWAEITESGLDLTSFSRAAKPVGDYLFAFWETELAARGVTREAFEDCMHSMRREEWLWLAGQRRFVSFAASLAGRLCRTET